MRTSDFDYPLPPELIAQEPATERDQSRLLVLRRGNPTLLHRRFLDLPTFLQPDDLVVLNDSRVIPARMFGIKTGSRGRVELLLLEENEKNDWWAMVRPGKRVRTDTCLELVTRGGQASGICARILDKNLEGHCRVHFSGTVNIADELGMLGEIPLPPYIRRPLLKGADEDRECYQTVFARPPGSVAAPTAGLHFTDRLFADLHERGIKVCFVTLHVGLGTFAPVKAHQIDEHALHEERFQVTEETARLVNATRSNGGRVVAVGTTTVRVLETVASANEGRLIASEGKTRIFIRPPAHFRVVDGLLTNFHLPRSTLLMLVSAFAAPGEGGGRDLVLNAYTEAIRESYRFFSYGDAMLIL